MNNDQNNIKRDVRCSLMLSKSSLLCNTFNRSHRLPLTSEYGSYLTFIYLRRNVEAIRALVTYRIAYESHLLHSIYIGLHIDLDDIGAQVVPVPSVFDFRRLLNMGKQSLMWFRRRSIDCKPNTIMQIAQMPTHPVVFIL